MMGFVLIFQKLSPKLSQALEAKDVSKAMILALALNDYALLRKVYEQVP